MVAEIKRQPAPEGFSPLELIRNEIETERIEDIPLSDVVTDFAIVDSNHAYELGRSISKKRGQLSPILVRVREEDGKVVYDVMDGFHRAEGMRNIGAETIKATVVYGCSDEEMFDLRILAASSVKAVQYARMADWMTRAFETTEWPKKGVTVAQAFGLTFSDSKRTRLDLNSEDLVQIKTWVTEKCDRWGKSVASTYLDLLVVSNADPQLVKQVRVSGGGKDREGKITPKRLKAVVLKYPGEENFGAQNAVLKFAAKHRLYEKEITALIDRVSRYIESGMSEEDVNAILSKVKLKTLAQDEQQKAKTQTKELGLKAPQIEPGDEEEDDSEEGYDVGEPDDQELAQMEITSVDDDDPEAGFAESGAPLDFAGHGSLVPIHSPHENGYKKHLIAGGTVSLVTGGAEDSESLKRENRALREALKSREAGTTGGWWESANFLNSDERVVMCALFTESLDVEQVANKHGLTPKRIGVLLSSSLTKKALIKQREKNAQISQEMKDKIVRKK
ncbi:MAG: hypothetical protein ACD_57C00356G0004 [uncultured bacterium]|nr:MAG: hypothetical protein ACD_57C00356G0004 [uncultured bacterium]